MVLEEGLEPTLLSEPDPKSGASANFAIRASLTSVNDFVIPHKALSRTTRTQGDIEKTPLKISRKGVDIHRGGGLLLFTGTRWLI